MPISPKPDNTAKLCKNLFCIKCGWPVIHVCCNDGMDKEPWGTDWWGYCSNKSCTNHEGQEWGQFDPEFTFRIKE